MLKIKLLVAALMEKQRLVVDTTYQLKCKQRLVKTVYLTIQIANTIEKREVLYI